MDCKGLVKKLLFLKTWQAALLAALSAAALIAVFVTGAEQHIIAYPVYVFSFYSLCVLCVYFWVVLPDKLKNAKQRIGDTKYGGKYMADGVFRTHVSLYVSVAVNILYVSVNVLCGIFIGSAWFYVLAMYYTILVLMRFLLLRYVNRNSIGENLLGEWKRARACAAILTLVNLALSGAILMMMYVGKSFNYPGLLIYVAAAYTFYITSLAVVNMVRYKKYNSPVINTAKIITLAAALVSMLALETAMLNTFGKEMTAQSKRIFIAATGAGISAVVLALSSYMIIRSTKEIERLKEKKYE